MTRAAPTPEGESAERGLPLEPGECYRRTLDRLHHAVMIVDVRHTIVYANQAMCQYIGMVTEQRWEPSQVIGRNVMDFHPQPSVPGTVRRFQEMHTDAFLAPRTNSTESLMFLTWDSRLLDDDGNVVGYVLEKFPASFNPEPLADKPRRSLDEIRQVMAGDLGPLDPRD